MSNNLHYLTPKESDYINKINNLINDLENQLKIISNPYSHYTIVILEDSILKIILELILKKKDMKSMKIKV